MSNSDETTYISFGCIECGTILVEIRRKLSEEEVPIRLEEIREKHRRLHESANRFDTLKREMWRLSEIVKEEE